MPAVMHESIAFFTSSLGGSSIPTFKRDKENIYTTSINIGGKHAEKRGGPDLAK